MTDEELKKLARDVENNLDHDELANINVYRARVGAVMMYNEDFSDKGVVVHMDYTTHNRSSVAANEIKRLIYSARIGSLEEPEKIALKLTEANTQ